MNCPTVKISAPQNGLLTKIKTAIKKAVRPQEEAKFAEKAMCSCSSDAMLRGFLPQDCSQQLNLIAAKNYDGCLQEIDKQTRYGSTTA